MLTYPDIDPVAIAFGPFEVHWYGLMYLVAFVAGWWLGVIRTRREGTAWRRREIGDLVERIDWHVLKLVSDDVAFLGEHCERDRIIERRLDDGPDDARRRIISRVEKQAFVAQLASCKSEHLAKLGRSLDGAVGHFNKAVGSFDSKVLPGARKFTELGISGSKPADELNQIEKGVREIENQSKIS